MRFNLYTVRRIYFHCILDTLARHSAKNVIGNIQVAPKIPLPNSRDLIMCGLNKWRSSKNEQIAV
jgi:hypothetical protein